MSDTRLDRARSGDLDALADLLGLHGPVVRARLERDLRAGAGLDVDDVMQVSYLEAFLRIGDLGAHDEAGFRAWLEAIARHNLADGLRALARTARPSTPADDDAPGDLLARLAAGVTSPSRAAARDEARTWLTEALAELPSDYARVVELYDLQGQDIDDVARALQRSRGAVHMLRQRAHDRLRARLGAGDRFLSRSP
ncbi:MAG: sigma-70 family RNA polymerase sigma factor [Planctomycetota bacterium]